MACTPKALVSVNPQKVRVDRDPLVALRSNLHRPFLIPLGDIRKRNEHISRTVERSINDRSALIETTLKLTWNFIGVSVENFRPYDTNLRQRLVGRKLPTDLAEVIIVSI